MLCDSSAFAELGFAWSDYLSADSYRICHTKQSSEMKARDLQPYLDYFGMLESYVRSGYIEVLLSAHEAYITLPALHTLAGTDIYGTKHDTAGKILDTARHIRAYAEYLNSAEDAYKKYAKAIELAPDTPFTTAANRKDKDKRHSSAFALHVVADRHPHDLIFSVIIERKRRWWNMWKPTDEYEIINY